ncbi:MAG: hypothetical protein NVS3B11_14730 [Collimonas sp.]
MLQCLQYFVVERVKVGAADVDGTENVGAVTGALYLEQGAALACRCNAGLHCSRLDGAGLACKGKQAERQPAQCHYNLTKHTFSLVKQMQFPAQW